MRIRYLSHVQAAKCPSDPLLLLHLNQGSSLRSNKGIAVTLKKLRTSKGDYWIKQLLFSIASLFKTGTSLRKEFAPSRSIKNLLPVGVNSLLKEQFFMVWK